MKKPVVIETSTEILPEAQFPYRLYEFYVNEKISMLAFRIVSFSKYLFTYDNAYKNAIKVILHTNEYDFELPYACAKADDTTFKYFFFDNLYVKKVEFIALEGQGRYDIYLNIFYDAIMLDNNVIRIDDDPDRELGLVRIDDFYKNYIEMKRMFSSNKVNYEKSYFFIKLFYVIKNNVIIKNNSMKSYVIKGKILSDQASANANDEVKIYRNATFSATDANYPLSFKTYMQNTDISIHRELTISDAGTQIASIFHKSPNTMLTENYESSIVSIPPLLLLPNSNLHIRYGDVDLIGSYDALQLWFEEYTV